MEKSSVFLLFFLVHQITSTDVIYQLEDAEYHRMPVQNHLDRYEPCVGVRGGVYCTAKAELVADRPNELMDMMRAYSAHIEKHYNYSKILYGLCVTKTCKQFYNGDNSQLALWNTTEACLNESLSKEYGLKARVYEQFCYHHGMMSPKDGVDWLVAFVLLSVLALNVVGTLYHWLIKKEGEPGNPILMSFSLITNWNSLMAPPSTEPRDVLLRPLNGIKVMTAFCITSGHVPIPSIIASENPSWLEKAYRVTGFHLLVQGHITTLTFFFISGFLLTFNKMIQSEKEKSDWRNLPKTIFLRWLRFTPVNLVIVMLTVSWIRHTGFGPFWWMAVGQEWLDCRRNWVYNLFYINNMIDDGTCNIQTWSLASDMQLHAIGLSVMMLIPSARTRRWALVSLFAFGILLPAYKIYTKDLDGTMLATPSTIITFFVTSDTFNYVYKRTYSNLPCFVMGMAFGYYVYDLQKNNRIKGDYTKYRPLYYIVVACLPAVILLAYFFFFQDAPRASMATRLLFAPIVKPLFGLIILLIILGALFKVDNIVRGILASDFWVKLARINYCLYATHVTLVRYLSAITQTLSFFSVFHMLQMCCGIIVLTVFFSAALHVLVELPFGNLVTAISRSKSKEISSNGAIEPADGLKEE